MTWQEQAACVDERTNAFFDDIWIVDHNGNTARSADADALKRAVAVCERCPVRNDCLLTAIEEESGEPLRRRFGVRAGLTPEQRFSLHHRGVRHCKCGRMFDPLQYEEGKLSCSRCGQLVRTTPLARSGDEWSGRHTTLGRSVVAWMVEHITVGEPMPNPSQIAQLFNKRHQDVARVFSALVVDGTLERIGAERSAHAKYVRRGQTGTLHDWQPPHLTGC